MLELQRATGMQGLVSILVHLLAIGVTFWILKPIPFHTWMKKREGSTQARLLHVSLSIALGHTVASFFLSYWQWSQMLQGLFFLSL